MSRFITSIIVSAAMAGFVPTTAAAFTDSPVAYGCLPPAPPFVPESDEDFREYVEVISASFEQYYSSLSEYFRCVDEERQAVFQQAKEIGRLHRDFYDRADNLGVQKRAAVPDNPEKISPSPSENILGEAR